MNRNSTASEGNWENVAGLSAKTGDIPKQVQLLYHETEGDGAIDKAITCSSVGGGLSGSDLWHGSSSKSSISPSVDSSLKEGIKTYSTTDGFPGDSIKKKDLTRVDSTENIPSLGASASSGEPIIGLKLGKRMYFEDICTTSAAKSSSTSIVSTSCTATPKRSRASYPSTQSPHCQVEGCSLDLKSAKDYHRRHKICEKHSKSAKVIVAGMERRFCQQCSRFHELSEFDDKKRSCRRRLSYHNARRRRPQPEAIRFNSARPSSSFYGACFNFKDGRQQMNAVLNRVPFLEANSTWQNNCSFKVPHAGDYFIRPAKAGGIHRQLSCPSNELPDATSTIQTNSNKILSFESSTPRAFRQGLLYSNSMIVGKNLVVPNMNTTMPSRHLRYLSPPPQTSPPHHIRLLPPLLAGTLTLILIFLIVLLVLFYRKITHNRTAPIAKSPNHHHHQCRCYSYSLLRRATSSFSPSNRLGHGGFGSVYKAILPKTNQHLAVKLMDQNGSLQGEREFHNELSIASCLDSPNIVSLLGYSCSRKKKLVLVYELMENRSLQETLFDRKCEELMNWKVRFELVIGVAQGLEYLHHFCNPPVIHGDIKPSNILLDSCFNAKIGDFGLARLKIEDSNGVLEKKEGFGEENGSILEETESVASGCGESGIIDVCAVERSPEGFSVRVLDSDASPEMVSVVSPEVGVDKGSVSEAGFDKMSVDSGRDLIGGGKKGGSRRDWWWKQDNGGGSESGRVKDYVMEWIGSEINKERPKQEWNAASPICSDNKLLNTKILKIEPKKHKKKLEWWASLDEERMKKKEKNRKPREWWKEEFCEELTKKKKKRGLSTSNSGDLWWQKDDDAVQEKRKRKRKSKGSIDWWLDGFSGEFRNGRRNSQDWASGEIPKSGGISSTPSMRGTVCYIAPEYGGGGLLSEKCDVYSFGVLLLVVVSGRRPLQVTASPMSEFERANLISWARQLACNGKLLDLVDTSVHTLDKDQAMLCITIGLLCLQRSPSKRPTMKEIVGMLSGEAEPPHLPFEFSPSPPSSFPFKSRRKAR